MQSVWRECFHNNFSHNGDAEDKALAPRFLSSSADLTCNEGDSVKETTLQRVGSIFFQLTALLEKQMTMICDKDTLQK